LKLRGNGDGILTSAAAFSVVATLVGCQIPEMNGRQAVRSPRQLEGCATQ